MNICRKHEDAVVVYGVIADDCPVCRLILDLRIANDHIQLDLNKERATSLQIQTELDARLHRDDGHLLALERELARLIEQNQKRIERSRATVDQVMEFVERRD